MFHELAAQRGATIIEGHMVKDHVHMLIKIPPKYSVAEVIGYLKGKSAIAVARQFSGRQRNFNGEKSYGLEVMQYQQLVLKKLKLELILDIKKILIKIKVVMN